MLKLNMKLLLGLCAVIFALTFGISQPAMLSAQADGLNLPTELYTLLDLGAIERYGLGAAGQARVTPDESVAVDFGVAPDGVWLAYRTENALILHNMLTGESRQLEGATAGLPVYRGRGQTIAWSPDATLIAYTVDYGVRVYDLAANTFSEIITTWTLHLAWSPDGRYLAAEANDNIWWVFRRENTETGTQMILTSAIPSSVGLAWVGAALLLFAPQAGGLYLMDVSNANAQSELSDTTTLFRLPMQTPDGTAVIFGKSATDTETAPNFAFLHRITPTDTGATLEQLSETAIDIESVRWSPDGSALLILRGGVLGLVNPATGEGFPLPVTGVVAYGWGALRPFPAETLALTASGYFIADDGTGIQQLWQVSNDATQAAPVLAEDASVTAYAIASDNATYAYVSGGELLYLPANVDTATALWTAGEGNGDASLTDLTFTPDESALVYTLGDSIFSLSVSGGEPQSLLSGYTEPLYSPDGGAILVRIADGDLGVLNTLTGDIRRLGTYTRAKWSAQGRILALGAVTAGSPVGVFVIDPRTDEPPTSVYPAPPDAVVLEMTALPNGTIRVLQTRRLDAPSTVDVIDIPLNTTTPLIVGNVGYITQPQLSPDGRFIAGYASAAASLVIYDLDIRREIALNQPARIERFRWVE